MARGSAPRRRRRKSRALVLALREHPVPLPPGALACDALCDRWRGMPHPHVKADGWNDDGPLLTISAWCSCGFHCGTKEHDVRDETINDLERPDADAWISHVKDAHGIDPASDKEWQRRATVRPR